MEFVQNTIISAQIITSNLPVTSPLTSSTSLVCDSTVSFPLHSTEGRTTAAIVPSLTLPGVDIVIYETVDDQQL
jgi:hypothetical protein